MVMMIFMLASPSVPQAITEVPGGGVWFEGRSYCSTAATMNLKHAY
jgi:hypothetical protein